jgi:signal transduction histidine kinase
VKKKGLTASFPTLLHRRKKFKALFIRPLKNVAIDLILFFLINVVWVYGMLYVISDTIVTMIGVLWVGIIAYRGGVFAGLLGCLMVSVSNYVAISLTAHPNLVMPYYFDNKMPGYAMGLLECIIVAVVVGYISQLIHRLCKEIQLRKKIQKDLEQKVAELDAFGHTVAHDLKNPLMVINVSIDGLIKELGTDTSVKANRMLAFISDGTKQMINIIESILMLAGVRKIYPQEFVIFPMSECVNDALNRMKYNIETNEVRICKPDQWPDVFGYGPWITEVWVNYINNAIKYGKKNDTTVKSIEIGYDTPQYDQGKNESYIRFWVKDNGEGISKEKIPTLFREFSRLHTTENGYGLGLSIVKSIIEKFEGSVGVESEIGNGSLFYFTLPVNEKEKGNKA